jgi:hypothetical protein
MNIVKGQSNPLAIGIKASCRYAEASEKRAAFNKQNWHQQPLVLIAITSTTNKL